MNFTKGHRANMSGLRGYVNTTLAELIEIFGLPDYGPNAHDLDKTTCEWGLKFDDGTIATIYDYKTNYTPMGEYEWHVGGYDDRAVEIIQSMINTHRDPLVKMVKNYDKA